MKKGYIIKKEDDLWQPRSPFRILQANCSFPATQFKAINNTGVLADATREKILRKAAEMGYKQFAYLPLFQEDAAKTAGPFILPSDKREIAMLTTRFLNNSHFSSMMLDRFQSEIDHLHSCMTIHRISPIEMKEKKLPSSLNIQHTAGIICFEVFDYDYAQMLCDLDVPLLFVDTPVMDMRPPLKADRLYMENRIEIQNAVAHMVQRGKNTSALRGIKTTVSPSLSVIWLIRMQWSTLV